MIKNRKEGSAIAFPDSFQVMRREWLASLLAKGFYIKASLTCLWIKDAALCHIIRSKDQLLADQTWAEEGLNRILKDRIFAPLSFCTTCKCKQTNPSSVLKQKNPNSKIWPSLLEIAKSSNELLYSAFSYYKNKIQGRQQHTALPVLNNSIVLFSPCFPEKFSFCWSIIR